MNENERVVMMEPIVRTLEPLPEFIHFMNLGANFLADLLDIPRSEIKEKVNWKQEGF